MQAANEPNSPEARLNQWRQSRSNTQAGLSVFGADVESHDGVHLAVAAALRCVVVSEEMSETAW